MRFRQATDNSNIYKYCIKKNLKTQLKIYLKTGTQHDVTTRHWRLGRHLNWWILKFTLAVKVR